MTAFDALPSGDAEVGESNEVGVGWVWTREIHFMLLRAAAPHWQAPLGRVSLKAAPLAGEV